MRRFSVDDIQSRYHRALGARILAVANDLKRTSDSLAKELNFSLETVNSVISGESDEKTAHELIYAMVEKYPISLPEIWIDKDDTDAGVKVMTSSESRASARVFDRVDSDGLLTPYYEYRDTAMSRGAQYKPEWIRQLRIPKTMDPYDLDVVYNNGHALHQTTFFVGEVNFYWQHGDVRYCAELNTGDSNYITPYVPHSFASRREKELGLIIAVTFGAEVQRSLADMNYLDEDAAVDLVADPRITQKAFLARVRRWAQAESLSFTQLTDRIIEGGIDESRARKLLDEGNYTVEELDVIAQALRIKPTDLQVTSLLEDEEVVVSRRIDQLPRSYPNENTPTCELRELARTRHQPLLKSFEVCTIPGAVTEFRHSLHEYIYNFGEIPVHLHWASSYSQILNPGDSAYVRPFVKHSFKSSVGTGSLLVVRTPGGLSESVVAEFSTYQENGRNRIIKETTQWF